MTIASFLKKYHSLRQLLLKKEDHTKSILFECGVCSQNYELSDFGNWLLTKRAPLFSFAENGELFLDRCTPIDSFLRLVEYLELQLKRIINENQLNIGDILSLVAFHLSGAKKHIKPIIVFLDKENQLFDIHSYYTSFENDQYTILFLNLLKKCKWIVANHQRKYNELLNKDVVRYLRSDNQEHYLIYYGNPHSKYKKLSFTKEKTSDAIINLFLRGEEYGVSEIASILKVSRSSVSNNIVLLRKRGIIDLTDKSKHEKSVNSPTRKYKMARKP